MTSREDAAPERPRETLPIPLFEGVVLAARGADGLIWMCLNDLCDVLNLRLASQRRRIVADGGLHLRAFTVPRGNQVRTLDFLLLDDLAPWLASIATSRISDEAQLRFTYVRTYLRNAVRRAFNELAGLPQGPSNTIEDLAELDRINPALERLEELSERQAAAEASNLEAHEQLRAMLLELSERVRELEHQVRSKLRPEQRHTIDHLVQQIAEVRSERDKSTVGVAKHRTWRQLNDAFHVTTYTDLPAARCDEIIRYLKDLYRAYAGRDIDAVEQQGLF
ncbi:MAG: hypothetical protein DIU80_016790 [Chloroflexota bacterium]